MPSSPPSPGAAELNRRWRLSDATTDLATAGVLVHSLDGNGIGVGAWSPPDPADPLRNVWRMDSGQNMNRMGAALINVRHPELFRCLGACGNNWYDLPAIVLKPSAAVQQRVNCLGWRDMGSLFFNCGWDSGDDCRNGCPPRHEWCDRRGASHGGGIESQQNCHVGGFLHEMPGCCIAFPPDDWTGVLAFQDAFAPHGPCDRETKNCDRSDQEEGWLFDEIILDRERYPWDPDLGDMIEAVIIAPWASAEAKDFARAVHTAILAEISGKTGNVTESSLPLLFYDVEEREAPFSLELPARFQPPCTSPDDSKCQDDGNDCCAPAGIGEVAACADGFVPVRFHSPCDRWPGWTNGKFRCCASA